MDTRVYMGRRASRRASSFSGIKKSIYNSLLPQFNKQALFILGSETAFKNECNRQKASGHWVIHPLSTLR